LKAADVNVGDVVIRVGVTRGGFASLSAGYVRYKASGIAHADYHSAPGDCMSIIVNDKLQLVGIHEFGTTSDATNGFHIIGPDFKSHLGQPGRGTYVPMKCLETLN